MSVSTTKESQQSIGPRSIIFGTLGTGFGFSTTCKGLFGVGLSGVFNNGFALALGVCNLTPEGFIVVLAEERLREDFGSDLNNSPERLRWSWGLPFRGLGAILDGSFGVDMLLIISFLGSFSTALSDFPAGPDLWPWGWFKVPNKSKNWGPLITDLWKIGTWYLGKGTQRIGWQFIHMMKFCVPCHLVSYGNTGFCQHLPEVVHLVILHLYVTITKVQWVHLLIFPLGGH